MEHQGVQLMEGNAPPPAVRERCDVRIPAEDGVEVRGAEKEEEREVGLPVAAMRRRVDEHAAA